MKEYVYFYKTHLIYTSDRIENLTDLIRYAMEAIGEAIDEKQIKYYRHF
jgi:hypothetical protein